MKIRAVGIVQGIGFRPFIYRIAKANKLVGYVKNLGDAGVETVVEGKEVNIENFLNDLQNKKPPLAQLHGTIIQRMKKDRGYKDFQIKESSKKKSLTGSVTPPDVSICRECLEELYNPKNPRFNYFFITCTNCGPRYSIIKDLPYDRANTSMKNFQMCNFCQVEYNDSTNRRFHAQTVACPKCGPKVHLATKDGKPLHIEDPIHYAGKLLQDGNILAIKGNGGFHLAATTTNDEPILRLRIAKHRRNKPFAIMACDLETIRSFAKTTKKEEALLLSHARPIVLLDKKENFSLSKLVAPDLHNIGTMLPYTGLHVMLFDQVKEPAFVMTSANPPNEPIITDNDEAVEKLSKTVDYFLFHNRTIVQRCDDSVVRVHHSKPKFIRRSKGYAPSPITVKKSSENTILGVGSEENVSACILLRNKAFLSQYIGDIENLEALNYLESTINRMVMLTNSKIDTVACDLHPKFATTMLAQELGRRLECNVIQVQHHCAHLHALMGEYGLDEIIGIVCDGYGYGLKGGSWGGEIISCSGDSFERVSHLQEQPMIGGDLATYYPLRMAVGILKETTAIQDWLPSFKNHFPHGIKEVQIIIKQLTQNPNFPKTTSCGRVLDAVSAILGICYERTYQGEPAIRLESAAAEGKEVLFLEPEIKNGMLNTTNLVTTVFEEKSKFSKCDLAFSTQSYIATGLSQLAIDVSKKVGINKIGFTGGVAYNKHLATTIEKHMEINGVEFYTHENIPPGDGGISFGQVLASTSWRDRNPFMNVRDFRE